MFTYHEVLGYERRIAWPLYRHSAFPARQMLWTWDKHRAAAEAGSAQVFAFVVLLVRGRISLSDWHIEKSEDRVGRERMPSLQDSRKCMSICVQECCSAGGGS
jgi:hypothetical protein